MSKLVATILVCLCSALPAFCKASDAAPDKEQAAFQQSHYAVPKIAGDWQGDASCEGQTLHVSLHMTQSRDALTGSLTSNGGDVVSEHRLKGAYFPESRKFVCEDVSVSKVAGDPEFVPQPVKHYEFRLSEDGTNLVGSALLDANVQIDLVLTRAVATKAQLPEAAMKEECQPPSSENVPIASPVAGDPTNRTHLLCLQARELRAMHKLEESRLLLEQACALDPNLNSAAVHDNLGLTHLMSGNLDDAISEFNKALSFQPKLASAEMNIAECYKEEGQIDQAMVWFRTFLSDHPEAPDAKAVQASLRALRAMPKKKVADTSISDYLESVTGRGAYRWQRERLPIRVYIGPGAGVPGYRDAFRLMIFRSLAQWIQSANRHITWRLVTDPREGDLTFSWTDNQRDFPHGAEQGVTKITCSAPHCIKHAEIKLLTVPLSADGSKVIADGEMELACLHEIGHALGLQGHSPNNKDVMFFCIHPNPITLLTNRDKATIALLYSSDQHEWQVKNKRVFGIPGLFGIGF